MLRCADQARQRGDHASDPATLVIVPDHLYRTPDTSEIGGRWAVRRGKQNPRQPARIHERVTDSGDVVPLRGALREHWLSQEVAQRDTERLCQVNQQIDTADLPFAPFNLAEPVLGSADETRQHRLSQAPATPVERDALADRQTIPGASHGTILGAPVAVA